MKKWVDYIVTFITVISVIFIGFYFVLVVRNLGMLLSTLQNKIEIYELHRQEEINKLKENDKSQLEIDKLQRVGINNLTKVLTELGILTKENDEKQLKLTEDIIEVIEGIQDNQFKMKDELKLTKQINLADVEDIRKANIVVHNTTSTTAGSGSHIVIKDKHYILTVAHLVENEEDFVWGVLDDGTRHPMGLIKINRKKDLALFEIFMVDELPYLEISDEFPTQGSEVVIIGNPDNLKDIITDGIIAKVKKNNYVLTNKIYFGNSGGAILYKGKIVGVITQIRVYFKSFVVVNYSCGVKLEVIKEFLDIK